MAFAFFEIAGNARKAQAFAATFPTIEAALAHFDGKVVDHEISEDGLTCDVFVNIGVQGAVYSIEAI